MISPSNKNLFSVSKLSAVLIISSLTFYSVAATADQAYGPVRSSDTLSKIVNRYYVGPKRSSISLMREIVASNPDAFVRGDMNLLKLGSLLSLPGDDWLNKEATFVAPKLDTTSTSTSTSTTNDEISSTSAVMQADSNKLGIQDRLVFLEAERVSLIAQVGELKRDNLRLQKKVAQLELESKTTDEQLRLLDAEIIRITKILKNDQGTSVATVDISQVEALQKQLNEVRDESQRLKNQLEVAQTEISNNNYIKVQSAKAIAQLTQENEQLNALIEASQPGIHYFGESEGSSNITVFGDKFKLPVWSVIAGGALLSLVLVALLSTRRRKTEFTQVVDGDSGDNTFEALLESDQVLSERGFTQTSTSEPEENVYKMFDEGSLEMDLKLDMAKAYLDMSDFDSAKAVLEEVIEGGSELQKRQANRLMKQAA